jgi:Zn-dependent M28 family amino/carboxypeptidase
MLSFMFEIFNEISSLITGLVKSSLIGSVSFQFMTSSSGTNFIGIMPGELWGNPQDRPIVVGAHWDSVSTSPGFNDNGSGVAALLV